MEAFCSDHFELFMSLRFTSKSDFKKSSKPRKGKIGPARSQPMLLARADNSINPTLFSQCLY